MSSARQFSMAAANTLCVLLVFGFHSGLANSIVDESAVPTDCLHCICVVESDCTMPSPVCQMDVGSLSCGPYQIKLPYWTDAKLKGGSLDGDWQKCTATFDCSERAVQGYMARFAISSRIGHAPTCEDFSRIHNGGPNGYKNPNTVQYWLKVKACLGNGKFKEVEKGSDKKNISNFTF